jgi:hypothetical protein
MPRELGNGAEEGSQKGSASLPEEFEGPEHHTFSDHMSKIKLVQHSHLKLMPSIKS